MESRQTEKNQLVKMESSEINPHVHGQLIFYKGAKEIQWRKDGAFGK